MMGFSGRWLFIIQLSLISFQQYETVSVTVSESSLEVLQGDSITLPCSFVTITPLFRLSIIWTLTPDSDPDVPTQVIVYEQGQVTESPAFTGRVEFASIPWSADVILNYTRISDAGIYRCVVSNPPEIGDPGIGELVLKVLAPPSLPVCLWEGNIVAGGTITLSCLVMEGIPPPQIKWEKLEPEHITLPVSMQGELEGSVKIVNLTGDDSGIYHCTVTNYFGSKNCYINLSVYTPIKRSPGLLQGVLLSLSMGLVLLVLLALVLWLHRSAQESTWRESREEDERYNQIPYTPSLIKRSFV